ncbi:protein-tyrosine phosphatase family protein [Agarivorans sp. 1_MG-2023]|uniref:phosphatase domain-containing putative toxin n=1 Tax=Agarivorans sp. 1_MG-2023 TaxID=3062634 RepID=UPI0026E21BA0|nr:protein-tyrosine phosphatase family protein [Agarivorans sp. 1_MG-2023]MDO6762960.1 tyrosine-protein phosphatase [Agarivorans sp. 1_MG-2023]
MSSHPVFAVDVSDSAQLLLTPCPGTKGVDLSTSLQQLCYKNSPALITMMTKQELADNNLDDLPKHAVTYDMQWFHLPLADDTVPDAAWEEQLQTLLPRFVQLLNNGMNLTIHCKGGSGRTGMLAARIMLAMGFELDDAIAKIKAQRPNAFTVPAQLSYIQQFAK